VINTTLDAPALILYTPNYSKADRGAQMAAITWSQVRKACAMGYHVTYNDDGFGEPLMRLPGDALVLRDNNGWIQATTPRAAMALLANEKG
jgi:hypothetical protein